ncbi:Ty3/gypsy retrotransposon protein, partial [Trifolium medium]|nr:Ty3/gypsy retrotransposon protein [Trifolium medium]
MRKEVQAFINGCGVCQQTKYSTAKPSGLLQPLPIPDNVWEDISMDFVTGLPLSNGYTVMLVVVDRFSKAIHLGALPSNFTAYKVAELFVHMVLKHHGIPRSIVSDRDPVFISRFWADLFKFSGTLLRMSSSYHPQTDGQTEVTNRVVEQYLRAFVHVKPSLWYRFLPWAELHFNTSYHSAAGMTPYQVVYGKPPPPISEYIAGSSLIDACDKVLTTRDEILAVLRKNLLKAQARMKAIIDKKRRDVSYDVGSWVYVKLRPHRQTSLSGDKFCKLHKRFYGPFQVIARVGAVAYKLELPSYSKIHNVFHCSVLKPHQGPPPNEIDQVPLHSIDNHPIITPLTILDSKTDMAAGTPQKMVLVQWSGLSPDDTSWENWNELKSSYNLEDKVGLDGVGIDTYTPTNLPMDTD